MTPSVPSLPTSKPSRSRLAGIAQRSDLHDRTVGHHRLDAENVIDRHAVFQRVRSAGVGRRVAADETRGLTRRIGRVVKTGAAQGIGDFQVDHARLDDGHPVAEIDFQNAVHSRRHHHDAAADRHATAGQTRARRAGNDGHVVLPANFHRRRHLLGRLRKDDGLGRISLEDEGVAIIDLQFRRRRKDIVAAERGTEFGDEGRITHYLVARCVSGQWLVSSRLINYL